MRVLVCLVVLGVAATLIPARAGAETVIVLSGGAAASVSITW